MNSTISNTQTHTDEKKERIFNSTDKPAGIDEFEISKHVKGLADFLMTCETPITISIKGEWGAGKTSMMVQLMEEIKQRNKIMDERGKVLNIWFDTWQFSQFSYDDQLPIILLSRLVDKISPESVNSSLGEKTRKSIMSIAKVLGGVGNDILSNKTGVNIIEYVGKNELDIFSQIENLKEKFQKLINEATDENANYDKIIIYIDDLDRLVPKRAVELLETLKIFLDIEKCIFVLAIDYDVVVRGVSDKYGFDMSDSKDLEKGKKFFDKIIQVPYSVPIDEYKFQGFLEKYSGSEELKNNNISNDDLEIFLINSVGKNPRSIKRVLNTFKLQMLIKTDFEKVEKLILFALICMEQAYPNIYYSFIEKFQDIFDKSIEDKKIIRKIVNEIRDEMNNEYSNTSLKEELQKDGNHQFLNKLESIELDIAVNNIDRIVNASISTSTKRTEKVKSRWKLLGDFDEFFKENYEKNHGKGEIDKDKHEEVEKLFNTIRDLFIESGQDLNIDYKSKPDGNRSSIQFKKGENTSIADLHLDKESYLVELPIGKKLENNEELRSILEKYRINSSTKRISLNKKDSNILENGGENEDFRNIIRIMIENK